MFSFDLSKAFDSLPHHLVINSLVRCGVCGPLLNWFINYLSDRWQKVVIEGVSSVKLLVSSGVPQGSILGPLLFILSVDTLLSQSFSIGTSINMFADDIALYKAIDSLDDVNTLQNDVLLVEKWAEKRKLRINSKKTKTLVISRKKTPPSVCLSLGGNEIEQVSSYKYLGVTICSDLRWNLHTTLICKKAKRTLGFLYRCFGKGTADPKALSKLYKSLVLPIFNYCSCVWDPQYKENIIKLEKVQSFAARLATGKWDSPKNRARMVSTVTTQSFQ